MEDKIYPNPIRHWLTQGLTLLILATNGTSEPGASGRPLLSALVQNYGLAGVKTRCVVRFTVVHLYLAGGTAEQVFGNAGGRSLLLVHSTAFFSSPSHVF